MQAEFLSAADYSIRSPFQSAIFADGVGGPAVQAAEPSCDSSFLPLDVSQRNEFIT
jgi:hypothetical protein